MDKKELDLNDIKEVTGGTKPVFTPAKPDLINKTTAKNVFPGVGRHSFTEGVKAGLPDDKENPAVKANDNL